ncbi:hypothetical protein FF1_015095 [Malus domestica]
MSTSSSDSSNTNTSTDGSDDEFDQLVFAGCVTTVSEWLKYVDKVPCRTSSYTGHRWVMEVLNGHPIRCHEQFRIEHHVFKDLLETLKRDYGLKRIGDIILEEALTMFLNTLGCIGAIDGTHVPVVVPREMQGAAHDSRKYYIVDAGYPHMNPYWTL